MNDLKRQLKEDHEQLERQLQHLARSVDGDDAASDLQYCWARFEESLRDHLDTEERFLFPVVGSKHRADIEALRGEHRHIRHTLNELGLALELHTLRKPAVDELLGFLRDHAAREDHSLYEWLEVEGNPSAHRGVRALLERHARVSKSDKNLQSARDVP